MSKPEASKIERVKESLLKLASGIIPQHQRFPHAIQQAAQEVYEIVCNLEPGWRPMATADKGTRTPVLLKLLNPIPEKDRPDLRQWDGMIFVGKHPGIFKHDDGSDFDIGWGFAAPVGMGGFPDDWMVGWQPLPE